MELRRASTRESRRRRVLVDEVLRVVPATSPRNPKRRAPRYQPEALRMVHRSLAHLIPLSGWTVTLIVLVGWSLIFGVINLHLYIAAGNWHLPTDLTACCDMTRRDSLAGWLNHFWWTVAIVYTLAIYSMRSHRMNDYRGTYRIWLPAIALLVLAQIDSLAGLSRSLNAGADWLAATGRWPHADRYLAWGLPLLAAIPACRLCWDLTESRGILVLVALSLLGTLAASVVGRAEVPALWGELWPAGQATLSLSSHFGLALAAVLAARRMYLDASDQLPASESEGTSRGSTGRSWNLLAPFRWLNFTRWRWPRWRRSRAAQPATGESSTAGGKQRSAGDRRLKVVAAESKGAPATSSSGMSPSKSSTGPAPTGPTKDQRPSSAPPTVRMATPPAASADDDEDDDDQDESGISRSERRRLRKEKRRQQSRAA